MKKDRCCWPNCKQPSEGVVEGKLLCAKHNALVNADSKTATDYARAKIKLKPIYTVHGRGVPPSKQEVCGVLGCFRISSFRVDATIPVCTVHGKLDMSELEKLGIKSGQGGRKLSVKKSVNIGVPIDKVDDERADWEARFASGEFD